MKKLVRYLPILAGFTIGLLLLGYAIRPTPIDVEIAAVTQGPLMVTVDEDGKTRVKERYIVSAPLSGLLGRIALHPGDTVEANQTLLATIEPTNPALLDARLLAEAVSRVKAAEAAKDQSKARLEAAREAHDLTKHELARAKGLVLTSAISQAEFDSAEHQERIAEASLRAADFADRVATFEWELAQAAFIRTQPIASNDDSAKKQTADKETAQAAQRLEIRSPVSGQVLRVHQESASVVSPGQQLLELGNTKELEIEIDVLSTDAVKIKPGAKVLINQPDGAAPLMARVRLVEPAGFTKLSALGVEEQRVNVIADIVQSIEQLNNLGDGYRVDTRIVTWETDQTLKVPSGALFRHDSSWAVFTVANQRAQLRLVSVGHSNNDETEILQGLSLNEPCIVYPSDKVQQGTVLWSAKAKP